MLLEYYLAGRLGEVWLRIHPDLRARIGDGPGLCLKAARDRQIQPAQLWQAQEFACRVWWRTGMVAVLLFFPVIGILAAVSPGRIGTDVGVAILLFLGTAAGIAMAQMFVLRLRANQTARYLATGENEPLGAYEGGYSSRFDLWAATGAVMIIMAVLTDAGLLH